MRSWIEINEGMHTDEAHSDQTNQYDFHNECSLRFSTEAPIVDIYRECALPFNALAPIDDIISEIGHEPSVEEQT